MIDVKLKTLPPPSKVLLELRLAKIVFCQVPPKFKLLMASNVGQVNRKAVNHIYIYISNTEKRAIHNHEELELAPTEHPDVEQEEAPSSRPPGVGVRSAVVTPPFSPRNVSRYIPHIQIG